MTPLDYIRANPAATREQYNAQPPIAKPSSAATYVTYLSIGEDVARFGTGAINLAGSIRTGLESWIAGPDLSQVNPAAPNPGALRTIADRLAGAKGVDLASATAPGMLQLFAAGVPAAGLASLLTAEQAGLLLSIGYDVVTPVSPEEWASARQAYVNERAIEKWRAAKALADAKASQTVIDADPAGATVEAFVAAYATELTAQLAADAENDQA